ncbi:Not1 N-terminal domain, CCR4-Not complex component-domain-containing protein [Dichotomocladium elegans]|nr:Not1 N-terminal domain, CCR4-Not complex component-domain-containing protein [Dichotomocladium elegans]
MSMKKLQTEIDRVLKKVSEGVETFEAIFDKIQSTNNTNQKEKYEQDLKKEIKKLQRLRDQIKTWLSSNEIKDKRALLENRKLIESQMERFKTIEKEMKTKAYSKEGLLQREKMDPKEKEKLDICEWIITTKTEIERQIEMTEAEVEMLQGTSKRGKKDHSKNERAAELEHRLERNRYHVGRLELVLRLLENDHLAVEEVSAIKDSVQYYVDCNQEPDFEEDEYIYDDLNLEEDEELYAIATEDYITGHDSEYFAITHRAEANTPVIDNGVSLSSSHDNFSKSSKSEEKTPKIPSSSVRKIENAWVEPPKILDQAKQEASKQRQPPPGASLLASQYQMKPVSPNLRQKRPFDAPAMPLDMSEMRLPSSLADLAPAFEAIKSKGEQITQQMLDASLQHVPDLIDSERPKTYQPRTPYPSPDYYPQQPLPIFDNPALFEKFDIDSLFFAFYYQQGTYQQYLAAKELKRQSWRFHKKYLTWFQRHEEPKIITDDFEQGTYIYFDYEGSWCQRKKTDFR